jgi:hypothetical protein
MIDSPVCKIKYLFENSQVKAHEGLYPAFGVPRKHFVEKQASYANPWQSDLLILKQNLSILLFYQGSLMENLKIFFKAEGEVW